MASSSSKNNKLFELNFISWGRQRVDNSINWVVTTRIDLVLRLYSEFS